MKSERKRQISCDIIYMWNLKYDTNEHICKREIESQTENRLVVFKGEGLEEGMELEVGVSRHKLLHIKWINNKVLLYSTGKIYSIPCNKP